MITKRISCSLLACAAFLSANIQANTAEEAVHGLAQGCYSVQSPENGNYLKKFHKGGAVDNGLSYRFESISPDEAARFFMKPTSFFNYMLTDVDGRYLASHLPAEVSAGRYAGEYAEWRISAEPSSGGEYLYSFHGNGLGRQLRHNWTDGGLYFFDLLNPHDYTSEAQFKLVAQNDCTPFPEVEVNVSGNIDGLKGNPAAPVRGYVDPHTHITSYEFMGGKMMHGEPFHRWGVEEALKDSKDIHGPDGSLDIIGNLYAFNDVNFRYDTRGWPEFPFWPNHQSLSHMGYYYKWIERAYLSGLKLMVTHLVENEVLCKVQSTVNPGSWVNPNSCDTMDSIRLQIQSLNDMQDYIDAQAGGPGKGFFQIVTSPQEARQVMANGQMAVLMGVEASETFNCGQKDKCNRNTVENALNELYDLGVRSIYPTHKFDNQIAGSRVENGFINIGQWLAGNRFFETKECDVDTKGAAFTSGFPLIGDVPFIKDILNTANLNPEYDETIEHCNKYGLSQLGVYLINRMIDKNMLIEMDHMSPDTADAVMDIVEARQYSGVVTSHSWMNSGSDGNIHKNAKRLIEAGGFAAPYNADANGVEQRVSRYLDHVEQTPYLQGVGLGTDMSGLGGQHGPRSNADTDPLEYPFTSEFGLVFNKQKSGNRVFDYNQEGMAHYGMLADEIQDIREQASSRVYEAVMNSAEAYLQMWERAEGNTSIAYIDPLEPFVKIFNRKANRCMDINGHDNNLVNGANVQLWDCDDESFDQHWIFNKATEMFENRADRSKCLDNRGQAYNNGEVVIWDCVDSDNLRWTYNMNTLASKHDPNIVADAYNYDNGGNVGQWEYHGRRWQEWELRPESAIHRWVDFRDKRKGKCWDVTDGNTANGTKIQLKSCNASTEQQWYFDPVKGTIKSQLPGNKCMAVPSGSIGNGLQLEVADCDENNISQQFNKDGGKFSTRLNGNMVIDASGTNSGDPIVLWESNGGDNQKWRAGLN
ncbi:ricin-type beta-trefoil lectin domain protein [Endozoicomonas elysicola]|uniref:Ricin B lectin n=1 Tax=Endozoicomonas elysicola TaxID=305900 RepID=A0A081K795_9GAMM|nr:ricin-type beta-trefoil lectin domain protein [Endozoicomonas elysicola]KEI70021.1 ricin B lectin [Endozoicomonas elysicola]